MKPIVALLAMAMVLVACGDAAVPGTTAPPATTAPPGTSVAAPTPAPPGTRPVTPTTAPPGTVPSDAAVGVGRQLEVDGFRFDLTALGAECARLAITAPDDRSLAFETCFHQDRSVDRSPACLQFGDDASASAAFDVTPIVCDVEAPMVTYGRVVEGIDYVCAPEFWEAGFGHVRFLEWNESRLILEPLAPGPEGVGPGHHYSKSGRRVGSEPLDAPSLPIYEMCERLAPWETGDTGPSDEFRYRAPIVLKVEEPEEVADLSVTFSFGSEGYISYRDGEMWESSLGFIPHPVTPTISIENVRAELAPLDPVPDLSRRWQLVITVTASAVQPDGNSVTIDPDGVRMRWVEE